MGNLKNLVEYDQYLVEGANDYEIDENLLDFEIDTDDNDESVFIDGDLYEASKLRMTAKDRKRAQMLSQLFNALNKKPAYKAAVSKFIKVLKMEAKKVVREEQLPPKVLKNLNKVTLRDINKTV